jgi:murein DD-endopeptidase MepM/ murein hydrolase activator NlpD
MRFLVFFAFAFCISCSQSQEYKKPKYISFSIQKDSIFVIVKNPVLGNSFLKLENLKTKENKYIDFYKPDTISVLQFHQSKIDTTQIEKNYRFKLFYGNSNLKKYDTLHNYTLPFLKGKRYKILQGNNTKFTHKGNFSRFAIDFKMNIGQTVCAMRDGLVIAVKEDSNRGGKHKKFMDHGNYIVIAHKDGTFAQYVHLKKDGAIIKKGDSVIAGQQIGYSGNTGYSTQPHLHFAVYKPTKNGLVSIPFTLNTFPSGRYTKGKYAKN